MRSAELFKKAREAKGIKQAEIALKSGLSRPGLARFETNSLNLSEEKLSAIVKLVDINPDFFQGITKNAFKSQNNELIKFYVDKYRAGTDQLITLVIAGSDLLDIFALSPPLTVVERIRHMNIAGNPLYAMVIKDDHGNVFLFRCKSNKDFMGSDISVATRYKELAEMAGKRAFLEAQIITKSLYEKIREWDDVTKADFEYLFQGKENQIRFKTIVQNDAEKILTNTLREKRFDPTEIVQMLNCMHEMDCKPADVSRILNHMQALRSGPDDVIRLLTDYSQSESSK